MGRPRVKPYMIQAQPQPDSDADVIDCYCAWCMCMCILCAGCIFTCRTTLHERERDREIERGGQITRVDVIIRTIRPVMASWS